MKQNDVIIRNSK